MPIYQPKGISARYGRTRASGSDVIMSDDSDPAPDSVLRLDAEEYEYLRKRAADHQQLAEKADDFASKTIHRRLRQLYEDRARALRLVLLH